MLARFAVDIRLLNVSKDQAREDESLGGKHRRLCRAWQELGILVHAAGPSERQMLVAIRNLPDSVRPIWDAAWRAGRRRSMQVPWSDVGDPPHPEKVRALRGVVDLVCIEDQSVRSLRDALEGGGKAQPPEVSGISNVDISRTFEQARKRAENFIRQGSLPAEVWSERFKEAAACAKTIRIIDRYAVQGLRKGRGGLSGLENFLRWVSRDAPEAALELYSAQGPKGDGKSPVVSVSDLLTAVRSLLERERGAGVRGPVSVYLAVDRLFSQLQHDRYFRYDDQSVAEVGDGCDVLGGDSVRRKSTFSFKCLRGLEEYREDMRMWEEAARLHHETARIRWPITP